MQVPLLSRLFRRVKPKDVEFQGINFWRTMKRTKIIVIINATFWDGLILNENERGEIPNSFRNWALYSKL